MRKANWKLIGFEFLSIFIAVSSAFALNNWNENRKDNLAARKILAEINNGLDKDIEDIRLNILGHKDGIAACEYWHKLITEEGVGLDSFPHYYVALTRDYISVQNVSGYETLKSRGLELIKDDALRFEIITLYEYDYNLLKKFEEEYYEMQYQENYFEGINRVIGPLLAFDSEGSLRGVRQPLKLDSAQKNILMSYLWKIKVNRAFLLRYYESTEEKLEKLRESIEGELGQ